MAEGAEFSWAIRPTEHGMYSIADLAEGRIDLLHIGLANEYLDVKHANQMMARERNKADGNK